MKKTHLVALAAVGALTAAVVVKMGGQSTAGAPSTSPAPSAQSPEGTPPSGPSSGTEIVGPADARHVIVPKLPAVDEQSEHVRIEGDVPGLGLYMGPAARAPFPPSPERKEHFTAKVSDALAHAAKISQSSLVQEEFSSVNWATGPSVEIIAQESGTYTPSLTAAQRTCSAPVLGQGDVVMAVGSTSDSTVRVPLPMNFPGDHDAVGWRQVKVDAPGKSVVLVLKEYAPTAWRVTATPGTTIRKVWALGYQSQAVLGVPPGSVHYSSAVHGCTYPSGDGDVLPGFVSLKLGVPLGAVKVIAAEKSSLPAGNLSGPTLMNFVDPSAPAAGRVGLATLEAMGYLDSSVALKVSSETAMAYPSLPRGTAVLLKPFVWPAGLGGAHAITLFAKEGDTLPSGHPWHSNVYTYTR